MIGGDGWTVPFRYSFFMAEFDEREIERREKERGSYNLTVTEKLGPCRVSEVLFSKRERDIGVGDVCRVPIEKYSRVTRDLSKNGAISE